MPYERELQWSFNWAYKRLQYWMSATSKLGKGHKAAETRPRDLVTYCASLARELPKIRHELKVLDAMTAGSCFRTSRHLVSGAREPLDLLQATLDAASRNEQLRLLDEVFVAMRDAFEKMKDDAEICYKPMRLMPMMSISRQFPQAAWERLESERVKAGDGPFLL